MIASQSTFFYPLLAHSRMRLLSERLGQELGVLQQELSKLPEGRLYIYNSRRWASFYLRRDGVTRGISKDTSLIYQLARKEYILIYMQLIEALMSGSPDACSGPGFDKLLGDLDALFAKFEKGKLDIDRITMTPNQYIWNSSRSSTKTKYSKDCVYPTAGRVYMRSKSEQALGNLLEKFHIPYRYEATIYINEVPFHPDFIIMLPNDRLIIIEHLGRMDRRDYNEDLLDRLQAYNDAGLMIGRDVFFTFEWDTRDEALLREALLLAMNAVPSTNKVLRSAAARAGCRFGRFGAL